MAAGVREGRGDGGVIHRGDAVGVEAVEDVAERRALGQDDVPRQARLKRLEAQALELGMDLKELDFYLNFFRYGVPPHGGFGMGLNRVLMLMLQQSSIREVTYLFRGPNRLMP